MSINYIKENLKKIDHDNLISFLFDIIVRGGIEDIYDFDSEKVYVENEKIYFKDLKGIHHIYKCKVKNSTKGEILNDEWVDLLQSFRKPIISEETVVTAIDIREEVLISESVNQKEFKISTPGVSEGLYSIVVFHPTIGRLSQTDFSIVGQYIILDDDYVVKDVGEKIIIDLYQKM